MLRRTHALSILALLFAGLVPADSLRAEVLVTGEADDVQIEISDASIEEVLNALGTKFGLRYRSTAPLGRRLTGIHGGSLQRVVARLLDGNDFVVKTGSDGVEVTVYGAGKPEDALSSKATQPAAISHPAKAPSAKSRHEARRKRHAN